MQLMTSDQQKEAHELLQRFFVRRDYLDIGERNTTCKWCDVTIENRNIEQLAHLSQCPAKRTELLLAALAENEIE